MVQKLQQPLTKNKASVVTFYKHLMSGVSQMLPFVIGGGIMIALAFLIDRAFGVQKKDLAILVLTVE